VADYNEMLISEVSDDPNPFAEFDRHPEVTDSEKLDYIYSVALKVDAAVREVLPQVAPMLESIQKNPMLKMFLK
jgi:hypothetical protein